jgi:hypothetical protein
MVGEEARIEGKEAGRAQVLIGMIQGSKRMAKDTNTELEGHIERAAICRGFCGHNRSGLHLEF